MKRNATKFRICASERISTITSSFGGRCILLPFSIYFFLCSGGIGNRRTTLFPKMLMRSARIFIIDEIP